MNGKNSIYLKPKPGNFQIAEKIKAKGFNLKFKFSVLKKFFSITMKCRNQNIIHYIWN